MIGVIIGKNLIPKTLFYLSYSYVGNRIAFLPHRCSTCSSLQQITTPSLLGEMLYIVGYPSHEDLQKK